MTALPSLPDPTLSRAILIGTSEFRGSPDLPDLPAVRHNLSDLKALLTHRVHGILAENNCVTVANPRTPHEFMNRLRQSVRQVDDFLLVYYAGHGVRHATKDDLYLTLRDTDTEMLNGTAVPLDWVKEQIEQSPARTRLLVLDCCYSGLAVGTMSAVIEQRELEVRGSAVIASSPKNAKSHSPVGRRHTAFTGQLVTLLKDGSPNAGEPLTVMTLFHRIDSALAIAGFPKPMIQTTGTTSQLLLRKEQPRPAAPVEPPSAPVEPPTVRSLPPAPPPLVRAPAAHPPLAWPTPAAWPTPVAPPVRDMPPQAPVQQPWMSITPVAPQSVPVTRGGTFWAQVVLLRVFRVLVALMMVMFVSSLFGVLVADPRVPGAGASAVTGLVLSVAFGVPLFLLDRRWGHPGRRTGFARARAGRVVLTVAGGFCLIVCVTGLFTDTSGEHSTAASRTAIVMMGLEGAVACGYHLFRTRPAPS